MEGLCKAMDVKDFQVEPIYHKTSVPKHRMQFPPHTLLKPYDVSNLNYEGWDFTIPEGFTWNGANTPLFSAQLIIPSLVHDYIYSGTGCEKVIQLTRKDADDMFLFYMKHCRIPKWWRYTSYLGVRIGGRFTWEGRKGNNTYESPVMPINPKRYNVDCLTCEGRGWYGITKGFGGDGMKRCISCNPEK